MSLYEVDIMYVLNEEEKAHTMICEFHRRANKFKYKIVLQIYFIKQLFG